MDVVFSANFSSFTSFLRTVFAFLCFPSPIISSFRWLVSGPRFILILSIHNTPTTDTVDTVLRISPNCSLSHHLPPKPINWLFCQPTNENLMLMELINIFPSHRLDGCTPLPGKLNLMSI